MEKLKFAILGDSFCTKSAVKTLFEMGHDIHFILTTHQETIDVAHQHGIPVFSELNSFAPIRVDLILDFSQVIVCLPDLIQTQKRLFFKQNANNDSGIWYFQQDAGYPVLLVEDPKNFFSFEDQFSNLIINLSRSTLQIPEPTYSIYNADFTEIKAAVQIIQEVLGLSGSWEEGFVALLCCYCSRVKQSDEI